MGIEQEVTEVTEGKERIGAIWPESGNIARWTPPAWVGMGWHARQSLRRNGRLGMAWFFRLPLCAADGLWAGTAASPYLEAGGQRLYFFSSRWF